MICFALVLAAVVVFTTGIQALAGFPSDIDKTAGLAKIQVPFIENRGQFPEEVAFYARTFGGTLFVTTDGKTTLTIPVTDNKVGDQTVVREEVLGSTRVIPCGVEKSVTKVNNIIGSDPAKWQAGIPTYSTVSLGGGLRGDRTPLASIRLQC